MLLKRELYALARLSSVLYTTICHNADTALGIPPATLYHTTHTSEKDEKLIIDELMKKFVVFDFVPGMQPCIAKTIDAS